MHLLDFGKFAPFFGFQPESTKEEYLKATLFDNFCLKTILVRRQSSSVDTGLETNTVLGYKS